MSSSEIEAMPYWEFEYIVEKLLEILEKRKNAESKAGEQHVNPSTDAGKLMRDAQRNMPKMPTMPKFKI